MLGEVLPLLLGGQYHGRMYCTSFLVVVQLLLMLLVVEITTTAVVQIHRHRLAILNLKFNKL